MRPASRPVRRGSRLLDVGREPVYPLAGRAARQMPLLTRMTAVLTQTTPFGDRAESAGVRVVLAGQLPARAHARLL
jgi:hypothetical protein